MGKVHVRGRNVWSHLILITWSALVMVPLWIMVVNSFKTRLAIYRSPFGLPNPWTVQGYLAVFTGSSFPRYFLNSIMITSASIGVILLCASLAAYAIARWNSPLSKGVFLFFLAGLMVPIRIGSINLLILIRDLGLMDQLIGLLPIYVAMGMPVGVFVLTEFIRTVPAELTQAAHIDGASRLRIFLQIILPLTRPAMATVAIFNLVVLWNDLWFPLIFIRSETRRTLMLGVTRLFGQYQTDWTRILSTLTIATVPIILLYILMARQFIRGLTAGAVKG
ncbi:carbohydrate ABC transporter permease [Alkalispirochaeta alkalica]|uniref:carbohydrate ABC transporter permease n=1 Tax=Alkalispirochaeta alkalica TaxID=46356 RepID=UPI0003660919|nr:carbohydrate ABC transporter permease [Alkalispirochaeta alkalica]